MSFLLGSYWNPIQGRSPQLSHRYHYFNERGIDTLLQNANPMRNSSQISLQGKGDKSGDFMGLVDQGDTAVKNSTAARNDAEKGLLPLPDWPTALEEWGVWWHLHIYGFSVLFIGLTLLSGAVFLRFRLRVQKFKVVFNTLLLLACSGVLRAVFMLVDPYGYKGQMVTLMIGILTQVVYPLFCACYGLTQVMLLRITKVDVGNSKVRSLSWLMGCSLTYLFLVVVIESVVAFERSLKLLLLLDSGCFIAWSLYLGITFICSGFRLSQYANEAKKARKELNAFSNNRKSANNSIATVTPSSVNTCDTTLYNVGNLTMDATSNLFNESHNDTLYPAPCGSTAATRHNLRLTRPKLKVSDKDGMMVTIASEDDDVSTSSTDVENVKEDASQARRLRKKYRHTQKDKRGSVTKVKTSNYIPVSTMSDGMGHKHNCTPKDVVPHTENPDTVTKTETLTKFMKGVNLSTVESVESYTVRFNGPVSQLAGSEFRNEHLENPLPLVSNMQGQELPLLMTPDPTTAGTMNTINARCRRDSVDSFDDDFIEDNNDNDEANWSTIIVTRQTSLPSGQDTRVVTQPLIATDFLAEDCAVDVTDRSWGSRTIAAGSERHSEMTYNPSGEHDLVSNSPRDNGYLADTENIFYCSSLSRACGGAASHREDGGRVVSNGSLMTTPTASDDDSVLSLPVSDRMRTITPAALGLFRIRQSKMVQRAVHLTYFLTFLFMFACLLQLYTVFGVYGVLGTIPRPNPWPWLIFHTIFRATELTIGLTTVFIAFLTLNHRHQRAKRRHQQQMQHNDVTRDCIV